MQRAYNRPRQCYGSPSTYAVNCNNMCNTKVNSNKNMCNKENKIMDIDDACGHKVHLPVGMAYVPMQEWEELYDPCEALREGTAFPCLNLIFCGVRGK